MPNKKHIDFTQHEFKVRDPRELHTFKFTVVHEVSMEYFKAQKEVLIENFEEVMLEYKRQKYGNILISLIKRKCPEINPKEMLTYKPSIKMINKATKLSEEWYQGECGKLNKTFNDFIAINEEMQKSMEGIIAKKQIDAAIDSTYTFIDAIIVEPKEE